MRAMHLLGAFLAALLTCWVAQGGDAHASRGNSFCPGGIPGGAKVLQQRMVKALADDPSGRSVKLEGCNATPEQFLLAFKEASPTAGLTTVGQLPEYIGKFRPVEIDRSQAYSLSCVAPNGDVIMRCVERTLEKNEVVYADHTGTKVMPSGCANPGIYPAIGEVVLRGTQVACVEARIPVNRRTHAVRWATAGSERITDEAMAKCFAYQLPGETAWTKEWPDQCKWGEWLEPTPGRDGMPRVTRCNVPPLGRPLIKKGGLELRGSQTGFVRVMLPIHFADTTTDYGFWICVEEREQHADGFLEIRHALGMITTPAAFQHPPEGESGTRRVTFGPPIFGGTAGQKLPATR